MNRFESPSSSEPIFWQTLFSSFQYDLVSMVAYLWASADSIRRKMIYSIAMMTLLPIRNKLEELNEHVCLLVLRARKRQRKFEMEIIFTTTQITMQVSSTL